MMMVMMIMMVVVVMMMMMMMIMMMVMMMMRRATFTMLIDWHQMIKEINCLKIHLCFFRFYPLLSTSDNKNKMGSHMVASGFMQDRECGFIIFPRHRHRCPRACDGGGTPGLVSAPRLAPI